MTNPRTPSLSNDLAPLIRAVNDYGRERLPEVMGALKTELTPGGKDYCGPCPVHGGDNPTALHLYEDGHTCKGNWFCATRSCERCFGRDLFGFVRGVLSHRERGWGGESDDKASLHETLLWFGEVFDLDVRTLLNGGAARSDEINVWASRVARLTASAPVSRRAGWSREAVRSKLVIPSPYFLQRGFPAGILDEYDVGELRSPDITSPMHNRAVVPIRDIAGERIIGFTGRDLTERSDVKWRHEGFASGAVLFNLWVAKAAIKKTRKVVLVEGVGDCLKMVLAGVPNVVATFGVRVSEAQQIILESFGVMEVVPLYDWNPAGRGGVEKIRKDLGRAFRVRIPQWEPPAGKIDVGSCTACELKSLVEALG